MQYGYFDDKNKEYVIIRPDTPTPWINYLGLDEYCAIISNTAGGYSFHKDPRDRRITRYRYNNLPPDRGIKSILVDGKNISGNILPLFKPGTSHQVKVIMGRRGLNAR